MEQASQTMSSNTSEATDHHPSPTEGTNDPSDEEYNPLIDEAESASDGSSEPDLEETVMALNQRLVNLRDHIQNLTDAIAEMEEREKEHMHHVEVLRNTVRRLRFSQNSNGERFRRDNSFFDASRRKFLSRWDGNIEYITQASAEHLGFLAAVIDLPKSE